MPQYLFSIHHADGFPLPPEEMRRSFADVTALADKMTEAGAFVFAGGVLPPESATVVRRSGDSFLMSDGPYTEAKEHLGGFWIINAADLDAALEWAKLATVACGLPIEVRAFDERDIDTLLTACTAYWSGRAASHAR